MFSEYYTNTDDRRRVFPVRRIFAATSRIVVMSVIFGLWNSQTCASANIDHVRNGRKMDPDLCLNQENEIIGICYRSKFACTMQGGKPVSGNCVNNMQTCCSFFRYECEVEVDEDYMYISSPGYPKLLNKFDIPSDKSAMCDVNLVKKPFDSSQIRIDFIDFNMPMPPEQMKAICKRDKLVITGGASSELVVCGPYSHQHIYYRLNDENDIVNIKFLTSGSNYDRTWKIKITRVMPAVEAPFGCFQYYTNASGTVQVINHQVNGQFMVDVDLNICIQRAPNVCSINYKSCEADNPFEILKPLSREIIMPYIRLEDEIAQIGGFPCIRYEQHPC